MRTLISFIIFITLSSFVFSQEKDTTQKQDTSNLYLTLNQDINFGFYSIATGYIPLRKNLDFTFYGNFYTNPTFAEDEGGTGLWTEFGVGLNFKVGKKLNINPAIGLTNGRLLSAGEHPSMGEGIAPNLNMSYTSKRFEVQLFGAYYIALQRLGENTANFYIYSVSPGIRLGSHISFGGHFEHIHLYELKKNNDYTIYRWLGGYIQFTILNKYNLRFIGGSDSANRGTDTFYKMILGIPLE